MKKLLVKTGLLCFSTLLIACSGSNSSKQQRSASDSIAAELQSKKTASSENQVVNYLGSQETIIFDGITYNLAWSHPPQAKGTYYIQEYMPDGQKIEKYNDIFILDLGKGNESIEASVKQKVDWLKERKSTDPLVNYKVLQNQDQSEYIVDLLVSDDNVIEWDVIRYTYYLENEKPVGIKTFTMSKRAYADNQEAFLQNLKKEKARLIEEFTKLPFPTIKLDLSDSKNEKE